MKFLFVILFIVTIASVVGLRRIEGKHDKLFKPCLIGCGAAVLLGLVDITGIISLAPFRGAFALMGIVSAAEAYICLKEKKDSKIPFKLSKVILTAFVLELTLFQVPSLPTCFTNRYSVRELDLHEAEITGGAYKGFDENGGVKAEGNDTILFDYEGIGIPVGSIKAEAEFGKTTKFMDTWIDMSDQTASTLRDNAAMGRIINGVEKTSNVQCSFSGNVKHLKIEFKCPDENDSFVIKKLILNSPVVYDVSFIRFGIIIALAAFILAVADSADMGKPVEEKKRTFRLWITEITIAAMTIAVLVAMIKAPAGGVKGFFMAEGGDQMTQQLVDAFENGRLYIDEEVPKELLEMDNPYDWGARDGIVYEWDHLLYKGKYYSYYGIAPVVLLYLPFHKITGMYMTQNSAVLIFTLIGLLFLGLIYHLFIRRFFVKIPVGCAAAGYIIMVISCGIWFSVCQPQFYQAAISAGFAAITSGAYFLLSSGIFSKDKISLPRTALSSLLIGISVMSRPTLAVYAVCAYVIYLLNIKRAAYVTKDKSDKKRSIKYALCGALPLAVLGVVQMSYNYARFGSPIDFGIQYSLTINDFTHSEFHINFVFLGYFLYLFLPPMFKADYPYITNEFSQYGINGYYYHCPEIAAGLFFMAIPMIGYLFSGNALKKLPDKKARLTVLTAMGLPCVIMPLVIMFSVWESGYSVRYMADFSWEMLIGALSILFFLYIRCSNKTTKKYFRMFMGAAVAAAVAIDIPIIYGVMFPKDDFPAICDMFSRVFAIWK